MSDSNDRVEVVEPSEHVPLRLLRRGKAFLLKSAGDSGIDPVLIRDKRLTNGRHSILFRW